MAIPLAGRVEWRMRAPYHVQLELETKSDPVRIPSEVVLKGRVLRVFRSDGRLGPGDRVAFKLWVCKPGDEPTGQRSSTMNLSCKRPMLRHIFMAIPQIAS
jgi:hypothetical protein